MAKAFTSFCLGVILMTGIALSIGFPSVYDYHSPCAEDEALYPVEEGTLAYPEGKLACVNIEELAR